MLGGGKEEPGEHIRISVVLRARHVGRTQAWCVRVLPAGSSSQGPGPPVLPPLAPSKWAVYAGMGEVGIPRLFVSLPPPSSLSDPESPPPTPVALSVVCVGRVGPRYDGLHELSYK